MKNSALFAAVIAMPMMTLPAITAAQDTGDKTGSISRVDPNGMVTEDQVREHLLRSGYTAIGSIERDSDGVWRTTAMKRDNMMAISVNRDGDIEDR